MYDQYNNPQGGQYNPQGGPNYGQQPNNFNQFGDNGMNPAGYRGIIDGGRQSNKLSEE